MSAKILFRRVIGFVMLLAVVSITVRADDAVSYIPNIHGNIRTSWEIEPDGGYNRFQVRSARLVLDGKVAPWAGYFIQTDLCQNGAMKILDAYGFVNASSRLSFRLGQFVIPFRNSQKFVFADRSYIAKNVMSYRAVGFQAGYTFKHIPAKLEAGLFNPSTITDHTGWSRTFTYAARATVSVGDFTLANGFASTKPHQIRADVIDWSLVWNDRRHWKIYGEYMFEVYPNHEWRRVHTWVGFVNWHRPVNLGAFNRWSIQIREEGMTDHLTLDGSTIEPLRNRITLGTTITRATEKLQFDWRINYEKYFYGSNYTAPVGERDKIVTELVLIF